MGALHRRRFRTLRPGLSRRSFLKGSALALAVPLLDACGTSVSPTLALPSPAPAPMPIPGPAPVAVAPKMAAFLHGLASGDPLTDRVILWTRVTLDADTVAANAVVKVDYLMSLAGDLATPVQRGSFITNAARDYTVKVDAVALQSYTTYYYQFSITLGDGMVIKSPIGRTKTAPKAAEADRLRFMSASCQNMTFGYFNAHGAVAKKADIDAVLFLGDYIYETGGTSQIEGRDASPANEIVSLSDYRQRHAQYKGDPDLAACHRQHPFICIWDDHETTNNSYRASADNHTEGAEGCWEERMGWAIRAYFEWMPIRDNAVTAFDAPTAAACPGAPISGYLPEGNGSIQRTFKYGDLVDIIMLDTRLAGRAVQNGTALVSAEQTILGNAQREWFLNALSTSTAQWKLIGQQMTFAPVKVVPLPEAMGGTFLNEDAWDGYRFDRNAVMDHIKDKAIDNVVFLSGDTHVVTAFDLPIEPSDPTQYNPVTGEGSLAVEFSNSGVANVGILGEFLMANNPHLKYANIAERGYLLLDITSARVQGEYFFTGLPTVRDATESFRRVLVDADGSNRLALGTVPSTARADAAPLAP
ncbi:MAG: alkaline phosphatase D family protein [Pseudomonadota bacterium]